MAWPDWAGPFGVPETREELNKAIFNTILLTAMYTVFYGIAVWHTIPRMARHHYHNPSRNAIIRKAASRTVFPSFGRGIGMMARANPVVNVIAVGMAYGALGRGVESSWGPAQDAARDRAMGVYDNDIMSRIGAQGPYLERPDGERIYYSFHPEWI